jgi:hypothetical protein
MPGLKKLFHAFLSHSHEDDEWVEKLAGRLTGFSCPARVGSRVSNAGFKTPPAVRYA